MQPYPFLADFFNSCLNQDYDLIGETLEEICAVYLKNASPGDASALTVEISAILGGSEESLDALIERTFHPEVVLKAFAADARAFLVQLQKLLSRSVASR